MNSYKANNDMPYFSIIIPVYNTERYLDECVGSVLSQTFDDYEVILIDDGSEDGSSAMCDRYAADNASVKVIHQSNAGLSAARNAGLRIAKGKYVLFVDSDDYIAEDTLEKFYEATKDQNVDVVSAYGYLYSEGEAVREDIKYRNWCDGIMSGQEYFGRTMHKSCYTAASVYKLVKRSLIEQENIIFKENILHEDELWTPILLCHSCTVTDLKHRFYFYRQDNEKSITGNPSYARRRAESRVKISRYMADIYDTDEKCHIPAFGNNIAVQYMFGVYVGELLKDKGFHVERTFPLKYARTLRYKAKAVLFLFLPTWRACLEDYASDIVYIRKNTILL